MLRKGFKISEIYKNTGIDQWFLSKLKKIVDFEIELESSNLDKSIIFKAKRMGFSDKTISKIRDIDINHFRKKRVDLGIIPTYKMVDTCASEFEAKTPYYYATYEMENEAESDGNDKTVVLGSGPIRIGQGIEFDYCSVHAAWSLQKRNIKSIFINSNPETVSTDYDTSDRLYFEPIDSESVFDVLENEKNNSKAPPTIVQFGGQTSINLTN